jgi:hypothetical protein
MRPQYRSKGIQAASTTNGNCLMNGLEIFGLVYLGIGLLITMFVTRGTSFTEGTKWYEKVLGLAFMIVLWPVVICVLSPGEMP